MLCQFTFKNFKSYRDETTFDFQAANLPELKDSLITPFQLDDTSTSELTEFQMMYPNDGMFL